MAVTLIDTSFAPASQFCLSTGFVVTGYKKTKPYEMWCGL